jgi:4-hydroxy-tetrahydrodipicolinate reductase
MRLLIVGHGRMGTLVETLAPSYGFRVSGIVGRARDEASLSAAQASADVAIDFTVPTAVPATLPALAARGINVVVGTTGWQAHEAAMRAVVAEHGIGVVVASNFSLGMNLFQLVAEEAARRFAPQPDFGAWIHELHHARKKDAPSGTALTIKGGMEQAGFARPIDVSSTRAGFIPGTHTVGFDGPSETIELTHTVRDRAVFARGALVAARWVIGRRGWFGMRDVLAG